MQMEMPRSRTRSTGKYPSPRFASVVGQTQMREPLCARRSSSASSACVAWTIVVRGTQTAVLREQLDGSDAVLLDAVLDLPQLLVGVDMQRELVFGGVASDLREPPGRAGTDGMGGEADLDPALAEVLDLVQVLGRRGLAETLEPAPRVCDVEQDERDPGGSRGLGRSECLLEAEVVELADRGVARAAHLAVNLLVVDADALRRLLVRELEHRVAPGPEVAALGAAAERSLEGVAVRVDEAGDREPVRHVATLSASPHLSWPVPPTSSPMRSYRGKTHVSVTKGEQMRSNRSTAFYP